MVERAKRQMCFRRDAGKAKHAHAACLSVIAGYLKQRRFADPGFAADNKGGPAITDTVNEPVNEGNVLLSPIETGDGPCTPSPFSRLRRPDRGTCAGRLVINVPLDTEFVKATEFEPQSHGTGL